MYLDSYVDNNESRSRPGFIDFQFPATPKRTFRVGDTDSHLNRAFQFFFLFIYTRKMRSVDLMSSSSNYICSFLLLLVDVPIGTRLPQHLALSFLLHSYCIWFQSIGSGRQLNDSLLQEIISPDHSTSFLLAHKLCRDDVSSILGAENHT